MNKREVSEELGCSTRQVEKYVRAGRLHVVEYVHGKTGREGVYDAAEVARLKAELETERRAVIGRPAQSSALSPRPAQGQALALIEQIGAGLERQHADSARVLQLLETIAGALTNGREPGVPLAERLTLSLAEAAELSGLSYKRLRGAIKEGKLTGSIIGRGWRVKRGDLDAYVKGL